MPDPAVRGRIALSLLLLIFFAELPRAVAARPKPKLSLIGASAPEWSWVQVLASPRIGGRLTAVTVDPENADRIFVGTEEGNLLRSNDGGVTWEERTLMPFQVQERSVSFQRVRVPEVEEAESAEVFFLADPPDRFYADDVLTTFFDPLIYSLFPIYLYHNGFPPSVSPPSPTVSVLSDSIASRSEETLPVRRIAICPGAQFPLLVANQRELHGSSDDGQTSLRLFFAQADGTIEDLACSKHRRGEIAVATSKGVFRSIDGGVTFNPVAGAGGSKAIAFAKEQSHNVEILYAAGDGELYRGDPDSIFGLTYNYPADDDANTAPWEEINWIEATRGGEVWLATDSGLRVSRDGGESYHNVAPLQLGNQSLRQVLVDEGERVAVLLRDIIYSSDDEGVTWHPFFTGATRRSFRQMAVGPGVGGIARWWVVTSGELWTNMTPVRQKGPAVSVEDRDWARQSLASSPPIGAAISRALENTRLSTPRIEDLIDRERSRALVPYVDFRLVFIDDKFRRGEQLSGGTVAMIDEQTARRELVMLVQATWQLYDVLLSQTEVSSKQDLYNLQKQIAFVAEDAWHERHLHLSRIAGGEVNAEQAQMLRARVEALETVLDNWGWRDEIPEDAQ